MHAVIFNAGLEETTLQLADAAGMAERGEGVIRMVAAHGQGRSLWG